MLDVARETYKENVGDIYALRNRLVEEHNLPFTLVYRDSDAGFVFSIKKADLDEAGGELPRGFIDATPQKGRWVFSSIELVSNATSIFGLHEKKLKPQPKKRNARMKDALDESLILSDKGVLQGVSSVSC